MSDWREVATRVVRARYAGAGATFIAGSIVRGEATRFSDIDLVVVFPSLDHAWRESFFAEGWPVEAFVHDPETLRYFVELDGREGVPSLAQMVVEGAAAGDESVLFDELKQWARAFLAAGPPALSPMELEDRRYFLTDLVDDLREVRSGDEARATGSRLYEALAELYLRGRGAWSARGKSIPRRLRQLDAGFEKRFSGAFATLFAHGASGELIALVEEVLAPFGGLRFEGHRRDAPGSWRC